MLCTPTMSPEESLWCSVAETKLIFQNGALICASVQKVKNGMHVKATLLHL